MVSALASTTIPDGDNVLLALICTSDGILDAVVAWDLPFREGHYDERYRINFGQSVDQNPEETRVEVWDELRALDNGRLAAYFQTPRELLTGLLRWPFFAAILFDSTAERLGAAGFDTEGLREAIARANWRC